MRKILLLIFIFLSLSGWATEDEKFKACEKRAYELYPEPNFNPRFGTYGARDPGRFSQNYHDSLPTLADTERATQKRQQYIKDCLVKE